MMQKNKITCHRGYVLCYLSTRIWSHHWFFVRPLNFRCKTTVVFEFMSTRLNFSCTELGNYISCSRFGSKAINEHQRTNILFIRCIIFIYYIPTWHGCLVKYWFRLNFGSQCKRASLNIFIMRKNVW